jgi:hypothetical protein
VCRAVSTVETIAALDSFAHNMFPPFFTSIDIDVTSVISITGKTFRLGCFPLPLPGICGLDGGRNNQIFVGAPDDVTVFGISFDRAQPANTTDGNGGAIKITGGKFTLKESQFFGHRADVSVDCVQRSLSLSSLLHRQLIPVPHSLVRSAAMEVDSMPLELVPKSPFLRHVLKGTVPW